MFKAHFIGLAIVEEHGALGRHEPFFAPPLNPLKLLTVVSVSFQSLTNTSLRGYGICDSENTLLSTLKRG